MRQRSALPLQQTNVMFTDIATADRRKMDIAQRACDAVAPES
jgi:hypothetical protein